MPYVPDALMILHIKVKPNSRQSQLIIKDKDISCRLKAPPVEGKANEELIRFLSEVFKLPKSKIQLLKGQNSVFKKVDIVADEAYISSILEGFRVK